MADFKFYDLMQEIGVNPEQLSANLKKEMKQFDQGWSSYQETQAEYDACTDPQEKELLMEELNSFMEDLTQADKDLCHKISIWHKNKDSYDARIQKMQEANRKKKEAKASGQSASVETMEAPVVDQNPPLSGTVVAGNGTITTSNNPEPTYVNANSFEQPQFSTPPSAKKEEGGSLGWWILGGALAIVTFGVAAKYLKK